MDDTGKQPLNKINVYFYWHADEKHNYVIKTLNRTIVQYFANYFGME